MLELGFWKPVNRNVNINVLSVTQKHKWKHILKPGSLSVRKEHSKNSIDRFKDIFQQSTFQSYTTLFS